MPLSFESSRSSRISQATRRLEVDLAPATVICAERLRPARAWGGAQGTAPWPRRRRGGPSPRARGSRRRARTARSAAATHAADPEPRSSRAKSRRSRRPSTPRTGWVIRRASSRVKRHSCRTEARRRRRCRRRRPTAGTRPGSADRASSVVRPDRPAKEAVGRTLLLAGAVTAPASAPNAWTSRAPLGTSSSAGSSRMSEWTTSGASSASCRAMTPPPEWPTTWARSMPRCSQ